jgi:hypothetical protein
MAVSPYGIDGFLQLSRARLVDTTTILIRLNHMILFGGLNTHHKNTLRLTCCSNNLSLCHSAVADRGGSVQSPNQEGEWQFSLKVSPTPGKDWMVSTINFSLLPPSIFSFDSTFDSCWLAEQSRLCSEHESFIPTLCYK